jgi:molybdenum cofactor cytidylyltransferase
MAERVLAAVLAAGRGQRFGGGKLDAPCAGQPLGCWALQAVAGLGIADRVIIVPPAVPGFAAQSGWTLIANPRAVDGLGTSLARAAVHALEAEADALLVVLADMPLVDVGLLRALLQAGAPAAASHGGRPGAPALLRAAALPQLTELTGDRGAAAVLALLPGLTLVPASPGQLHDVDDAPALAHAARLLQTGP